MTVVDLTPAQKRALLWLTTEWRGDFPRGMRMAVRRLRTMKLAESGYDAGEGWRGLHARLTPGRRGSPREGRSMIRLAALTQPQRRALSWLPGDGSWTRSLTEQVEMLEEMRGMGLAENDMEGSAYWRLSPDGMALKAEVGREGEREGSL
ncbi:hypothetical protein [Roseomonas indoligenes]|uniref:Uncharacterized protein n=1 Tax=Roseomonas indoligenes TaxID=2820811 RepID=A0A940MUF9_9PROT|nr:hypothetical protein [Pararoseomonas indoligenes]MBP0492186.1 hypothetical protein [Pararoseomonas indoligenes]